MGFKEFVLVFYPAQQYLHTFFKRVIHTRMWETLFSHSAERFVCPVIRYNPGMESLKQQKSYFILKSHTKLCLFSVTSNVKARSRFSDGNGLQGSNCSCKYSEQALANYRKWTALQSQC